MRLRVLVSFHYHRDTDLDALVSGLGGGVDLFADSGAYSAWSTGAQIDVEDYATWLHRWGHLIGTRANLDVIGDRAGTARNQEILTGHGLNVLPVFHLGEPFRVLESLCEAHDYVALGGLVPYLAGGKGNSNRSHLMAWMVKAHLIARKRGAVLHAFGCTGSLFLWNLPFYSADSSSYSSGTRFGKVYLWDESAHLMRCIDFRTNSEMRRHAGLFRRHGISPGAICDPEFMNTSNDHYRVDRTELEKITLTAYRKMEQSLTKRHCVPAPGDAQDTGTKIYFALTTASPADLEPLRRALQEEN